MTERHLTGRTGAERTAWTVALVTLALVGVIGLAAPAADPALAWGVNAARFLPAGVTLGLLALALAVPLALLVLAPRVPKLPAFAESIVAAAAFAAFAWTFRVSHVLLGDGIPITSSLPDSNALHPREPLSSALLRRAWDVLGPAFAVPGRAREAVVQDVAAVVSVAAGAVFAIAVTGIARELARAFPSESREGSADDRATTALLTLLIATPGAELVFFGYVEHYAGPAACTMIAALRLSSCGTSLGVLHGASRATETVPLNLIEVILAQGSSVIRPRVLRVRRPAFAHLPSP